MQMTLDLAAIVAIALSGTATLSRWLGIPRKLRGWIALLLIVGLHITTEWGLQPDLFNWRTALSEGLAAGLAAIGIYSTNKNTREQWQLYREKIKNAVGQKRSTDPETEDESLLSPNRNSDNINPYV
ncbi:hypothetical protein LOK74_01535 [Brevibacillus humidisoli]|uniref:hypothetical protein n=1 Tax=Brevibacillus humidisoli TaxID=2895522 RepID=UPI001E6240A0|nr:hypothetical protein [Brevibacillus humidisoli]UFJ41261.1 hypothetical protein LOK74_01535 [Brevibacillus humidisoli]